MSSSSSIIPATLPLRDLPPLSLLQSAILWPTSPHRKHLPVKGRLLLFLILHYCCKLPFCDPPCHLLPPPGAGQQEKREARCRRLFATSPGGGGVPPATCHIGSILVKARVLLLFPFVFVIPHYSRFSRCGRCTTWAASWAAS